MVGGAGWDFLGRAAAMTLPALVGVVGTTLVPITWAVPDTVAEGAAETAAAAMSSLARARAGAEAFLATAAGEAPGFRMVAVWFESIWTWQAGERERERGGWFEKMGEPMVVAVSRFHVQTFPGHFHFYYYY